MGSISSQITSLTIVYWIVYSDADQRKHQSSASLAFVRGIHRGPANSPHKWPVTRKMFPFADVIMNTLRYTPRDYLSWDWYCPFYPKPTKMTSYGHHGVSNHRWPICLFNRSFRLTTKKAPKLCTTGSLWGEITDDRWIPIAKGQ